MGRTYTMAAAAQAYARSQDWRGYTTTATYIDEATSLTREDLERAYQQMAGIHPDDEMRRRAEALALEQRRRFEIAMAKHQAAKDAEELNKQLAEPFWAWYDRRSDEKERIRTNDSATSSTDIRVRSGPSPDGDLLNAVAYSLRVGRMASQSTYGQDAITARVDQAYVDTRLT